jgi:hypothetical protein
MGSITSWVKPKIKTFVASPLSKKKMSEQRLSGSEAG